MFDFERGPAQVADPRSLMGEFFHSAWNQMRESSGYPVSLMKLLEAQSVRMDLTDPPCIAWASVVRWDQFGRWAILNGPPHFPGTLRGFKCDHYGYSSFALERPQYDQIGQCVILEDWVCDIREVHGFAASRSDLRAFSSTDAWVEAELRELIPEVTAAHLAKNLEDREIRILHDPKTSDHFERLLWDGRLFLMNDRRVDHFVAAKYIAARLGQRVPIYGKLCSYALDERVIASIRREFELFALPSAPKFFVPFCDAMRNFRATWLWHLLPRPCSEHGMAVLFPKAEARSMHVAQLLRQAGALDLGEYLSELCSRQYAWSHRLGGGEA